MKIALLGTAPSSRLLAPFSDPSWEIWACSPGNMDLPRIDVFFEIHGMDLIRRDPSYTVYLATMKTLPKVYLLEKDARFPNSISYPAREMFSKYCADFFTSSLSYMFALALEQEPEAIALYGVDMNSTEEYSNQRPGCKYFIELCKQRGVEVVVPPESDILAVTPPYGFRENNRTWRKLNERRKELVNEIRSLENSMMENRNSLIAHKAGLELLEYVMNTHVDVLSDVEGED